MNLRNRILLFAAISLFTLGALLINEFLKGSKARLIFCDVGQGDAIFFVSESGKQVLVDGGPGAKILDCLSTNMPFWDRSINMVIATHPQKDHLEGLLSVLERYEISLIASTGVKQESALFDEWEEKTRLEGAKIHHVVAGEKFVADSGSHLEVLWPTADKALQWQLDSPNDLNDTSIVLKLRVNGTCVYLTGDVPKQFLVNLIDETCKILKISHHGSKTGTDLEILERAKPEVAVIQVGKNSYGHPSEEVLDLLTSKGIKILRNDTNGSIEIEIEAKGLTSILTR